MITQRMTGLGEIDQLGALGYFSRSDLARVIW